MNRQDIEQIAQDAIRKASGKKLSEAIKILADEIEHFYPQESSFVIDDIPPAVVQPGKAFTEMNVALSQPIEKLEELAPITGPVKKSSPYREYRTVGDIMTQVTDEAPGFITIKIQGPDGPVDFDLVRNISSVNDGVQLAYRPKGSSTETPCPKAYFWITDEHLFVDAAMAAIKIEAPRIYVRRPQAISRAVNMGPVEGRMNGGETV